MRPLGIPRPGPAEMEQRQRGGLTAVRQCRIVAPWNLGVMVFVESSRFSRDFARQASEEDLRLIPGTGGLRKLRWASPRQQKGKRGGLRLLYLHIPEVHAMHLLHCFAKNEKEELAPDEKRQVRRLVEQLKDEAKRSRRRR